jgi:hypothetical protein
VYPSTFGSQGTDEDTLEHKHTENESVNRTLTKTNPKFGTWQRTFPGRIHSGVHMRKCGVSSSIQCRCKAVGAVIHSSLVKRQLKKIQDRNDYHMTR